MNLIEYLESELDESLKRKYVVRNGKRVAKWKSSRPDKYRIQYVNGKPTEVRITATERRKRKLGQRQGKLKRKSKTGMIELKRKRSFIARRNIGIDYNKKVPDIVYSRGPNGRISGKFSTTGPVTLHPENESFLFESPHAYLFTDKKGNEYFWDFYAEVENDRNWLQQIIDIYKNHKIISMRKGEEKDNNRDYAGELSLSDDEVREITSNLKFDMIFITTAAVDFMKAPKQLRDEFVDAVPDELMSKIEARIQSIERKKRNELDD